MYSIFECCVWGIYCLSFIPFYNDTAPYWSKWFKRIYLWYHWDPLDRDVCVYVMKSLMCWLLKLFSVQSSISCFQAQLKLQRMNEEDHSGKISVVVNKNECVLRAKSTSRQVVFIYTTKVFYTLRRKDSLNGSVRRFIYSAF